MICAQSNGWKKANSKTQRSCVLKVTLFVQKEEKNCNSWSCHHMPHIWRRSFYFISLSLQIIYKHFITILPWKEVLYHNSTRESNLDQDSGFELVKQRKYISKHLFKASNCPSVCGWWEELMAKVVPLSLNSCCQKRLVKTWSVSDTILFGILCNLTTVCMNVSATLELV